jgi:hypothetical protein
MTSNLNANGNRLTDIAPNQATGDALSQKQSHLNDLGSATAGYDMGGNKLQGLQPNSTTGDALSQGQSHLRDLATAVGPYKHGQQQVTESRCCGYYGRRAQLRTGLSGNNATQSLEDVNVDSENGSISNCLLLAPVVWDSSFYIKNVSCASTLAPIKLDSRSSGGVTQSTAATNVSIEDSNFTGMGAVPAVDASAAAASSILNGVIFKNDTFNGHAAPPNGWVTNGIPFSVIGGPLPQFGFAPAFNGGLNHLAVNSLAGPAAPTTSVVGATGATSYGPYYVVCHDANGGPTNVSAASNTVANGPATLTSANYIQINWNAQTGCASWDVLKGDATNSLATGLAGSTLSLADVGQSTASYTPPTRNTTGDLTVGGLIVSAGISWPLPPTIINGSSFYCRNCDPPANPPVACTSTGLRSGAWVHGLNNQWICAP